MVSPKASILNGFTLIEILITMGIMVIIFTIGLFFTLDMYKTYTFHSEQSLAVSVLQKARSQAMANIDELPHGVFLDTANNQYVIFEGSTHTSYPSKNITVPFISANSVTSHSWTGATEVLFNQLDGSISTVPANPLRISQGSHSTDITFNIHGLITWTN